MIDAKGDIALYYATLVSRASFLVQGIGITYVNKAVSRFQGECSTRDCIEMIPLI
jgi:hypothetical protein